MRSTNARWAFGAVLATLLAMAASLLTVPAANAAVTATWVRQIGRPGHAGLYAWGAATALDGSILVGDYNNYNVKRYSTSGQLLQTISSKGTNPGQINQPYGLGVDPVTGAIYVVDTIPRQIEVFNADGSYKTTWDINPTGGYYTTRLAVNNDGWVYTVNSQSISQTAPHTINVYDRDGHWMFKFGSTGSGPGQTYGYRGIAIGHNDEVYVLDAGNKRVLVYDRNGVYLRTFGTAGTGPGKIGFDARGLALDLDNDWAYVSDASDGTIEKFSLSGTPLGTFTVPGIDPGSVGGPREITVGQDHNLYVMDYSGERMLKFSPSGTILSEVPSTPSPAPNGGFNQPEGISVDQTSGQVYVTDTFNHRIQRFSATGTYQAKWGYRGRGTGDAMDYPRGIAVDPQDRTLWMNNTRSANIKHYTSSGSFLGDFGTQGAADDQFFYSRGIHAGTDGRLYVPDSGNRRLKVMSKTGALIWSAPCGTPALTGNYVLFGCTSVDRDSAGNVYAAAPTEDVIYKFSSTGTLIAKYGTHGTGEGQFDGAYGVAVRGNRMYVSEMDNNRISVLSTTGQFLGSFGGAGTAHGKFRRPTALAFDSTGRLYVTDTGNERVEVFNVNVT
jgi:tripartite motif-containing protein 71